jgi:hypothetical protein
VTGLEFAAVALIGVLIGRFLPDRRRGPRPPKPVQPICGCEHHHSYHDPETGHCGHAGQVYLGNGVWEPHGCGCRQYSGPQPLPEFYAPEVTS